MIDKAALERLLFEKSGGRYGAFRDRQWRAVSALLEGGPPILLVEATGWGKSLVYFAAALAFRAQGLGPVLAISPLQSLMRDQLRAAARAGLAAAAIFSPNRDEWGAIGQRLRDDELDLLLISPERLGKAEFIEEILEDRGFRPSLLAIDEAHCLSEWGHDFRPDYQRVGLLAKERLGREVPVLAATATAGPGTIRDLERQLGPLRLLVGPLDRPSLKFDVVFHSAPPERLAWLAANLEALPGTGVLYAPSRDLCEKLALWLGREGIEAAPYHAGLTHRARQEIERRLLDNRLKLAVATTALGAGFDKPDLGFVLHWGAPLSLYRYYQEAGRAGRAIPEAYAILLAGEDEERSVWFLDQEGEGSKNAARILDMIEEVGDGIDLRGLAGALSMAKEDVARGLTLLEIARPSPVYSRMGRWFPTFSPLPFDRMEMNAARSCKRREWEKMKEWARTTGCLSGFLLTALGEEAKEPCGRCSHCLGRSFFRKRGGWGVQRRAARFARENGMAETARQSPSAALVEAVCAFLRIRR